MYRFDSEAELAEVIVRYLIDFGWDVYQEVELHGIADIVAINDQITWVIETKRTFGLGVLSQANQWARVSNKVSIGIPIARMSHARSFGEHVARNLGIGVFQVSGTNIDQVREVVRPTLRRFKVQRLRAALCSEQKTFAKAGNAERRRWTPFKQTCDRLRREVDRSGSLPLKDLIARVDHHYASAMSARGSLKKLIEDGVIDGLELRREDRILVVVGGDPDRSARRAALFFIRSRSTKFDGCP